MVHRTLRFGPFELSSSERMLRRDGVTLPLGSRAFDILVYLAERPGEVIGKKELIDHVWWNVAVEEGSLRVHVAAIRKALRDGQFGNRYIANVRGRGYSFVGSVVRLEDRTEHVSDWHMKARLRYAPVSPNTHRRSSKLRSVRFALNPPSAQGRLLAHRVISLRLHKGGRCRGEPDIDEDL